MEYKIFFLFLIYIQLSISKSPETTDQGAYGSYKVSHFVLQNCEKVMKPRGEVYFTSNTKINAAGHREVVSTLTFAKDIGPLMGKTRIYRWTDGKYVKTLTMNQANVCQYAFPLKMIPMALDIDKNCIAKPATYNTTLDVENLARGLLGKKFFFGKFRIIFEWFTKKLTAICCEVEAELSHA